MSAQTLYDKLTDNHTVENLDASRSQRLLFIDRTVVNEYTSPQAFNLLRERGFKVRHPEAVLGTVDHVNSSSPRRDLFPDDSNAAEQVKYLIQNGRDFRFEVFNNDHPHQGIEHVVMCEEGRVLPGMFIGAGDSHTAMYGALGCAAYGIGTSDIYHYLATSTLRYKKLKNMRVRLLGKKPQGVSAKDLIIYVVKQLGAGGCSGYCVEFTGDAISELSIEERLTFCNMAVECAARTSLIAPDEKTIEYLKGREKAPKGEMWEEAVKFWKTLKTDEDAVFDKQVELNIEEVRPMITWGTSPDMSVEVNGRVPDPTTETDPDKRRDLERALAYMDLKPGQKLEEVPITHAFIGSCTNSRIEDLRAAAAVLKGRRIAPGVTAWVVPGSMQVRRQAEQEGIDKIFKDAGWEWRMSGCSLCLAMNGDILEAKNRCISATNRNFEGRQGVGTKTHLASPVTVAESSVSGFLGKRGE